jgi:hypothetical protein
MKSTALERLWLEALLLSVGIAVAGWFVGQGFFKGRSDDRFVTVKGLSEREVEADLALWPLQFVATDDDVRRAQSRINQGIAKTLEFLTGHGIDAGQCERQGLRVTDMLARPFGQGPTRSRFIVNETLMVRSNDPHQVLEASQRVGELVSAGVVLSSGPEYGSGGPTFIFSRLSGLKPEMIAEATTRAREAAEQFAADSKSQIGGIRRANQGVFVILPRDQAPGVQEASQLRKTVRVVSTVEYFLQD